MKQISIYLLATILLFLFIITMSHDLLAASGVLAFVITVITIVAIQERVAVHKSI